MRYEANVWLKPNYKMLKLELYGYATLRERTKLLKLGALITVSTRRVLIVINSSCPYKHIYAAAYRR
ncbi:hypothetical protein [Nodularia chucula]|uniref:hypothetical protein n=1 Tax=Nodularia chucula TaxID=3093667 RepID=UPI0039C6EF52